MTDQAPSPERSNLRYGVMFVGYGCSIFSIGVVIFGPGDRVARVAQALGFAWIGLLYFALGPLMGWVDRGTNEAQQRSKLEPPASGVNEDER